ncbi:MAG: hypothetical protein ACFBSF_15085 [Leptolyngbyaceae cyanobacterium]
MDKNQQESRRSATREFISSLDTLKAVLRSEDVDQDSQQPAVPETSVSQPAPELSLDADLETLLDDAVRDIERFMSEKPSE